MPQAKRRVYLTNITLHAREFRQTLNFTKARDKGRLYTPLPPNYHESKPGDGLDFSIPINIPKDLQDQIDRGEVELMMPKGGIPLYAGKDVWEKLEQMQEAERRQFLHTHPTRTWSMEEDGVK